MILDVTLDKNGQMINGQFMSEGGHWSFERGKNNIRRMNDLFGNAYLPVGNNDREWSCLGNKISPSDKTKYIQFWESVQGAFEIFLELARLKTVIM